MSTSKTVVFRVSSLTLSKNSAQETHGILAGKEYVSESIPLTIQKITKLYPGHLIEFAPFVIRTSSIPTYTISIQEEKNPKTRKAKERRDFLKNLPHNRQKMRW